MTRRRRVGTGVVITVIALGASTPSASAYQILVANSGSDSVSVISTLTNSVIGSPITVGDDPSAIAISPDGRRAYVANRGSDTVSVIDVATRALVGTPISVPQHPIAIAVSPDGTKVYVSSSLTLRLHVINTATNAVSDGPIDEMGPSGATGLAITPNGRYAYVGHGGPNNWVNKLDLANPNAEPTRIHLPSSPEGGIAADPDGSRMFAFSGGTYPIDTASNAVGQAIGGPAHALWIAVSPDGSRAYLPSYDNNPEVVGVNLITNTVNPFTTVLPQGPNFMTAAAITPDGSGVYVAGGIADPGEVVELATANNQPVGQPIEVGLLPSAMAIVPDQSPTARLGSASASAVAGVPLSLDASASSDSNGTVARYDWEYGDGSSAADAGAQVSHAYAAGTYTATVTVTDDIGCSVAPVFTGQTASCSGSPRASATQTLVVAGIELGAPKKNKRKGTATVSVQVPSAGKLVFAGKGLKSKRTTTAGADEVTVRVRTKGPAKRKLKRKGKLTVHATVTFTPVGGAAESQSLTVKLKAN